jgi:hypothetical protein
MIEELIVNDFITGPELGIRMTSLTHLNELTKESTVGQAYVEQYKEMRFRMSWGCHLTPWPDHLRSWNRTLGEQKRISVHYNTYKQYHPGYLTLKENMVEDSVKT